MSQRIEVEIDDEGRLILPSPLGQRLGLSPGTTLVVEAGPADATRLRVQEQGPRLVDKGGVLVVEAENVAGCEDSVRDGREERMAGLTMRFGQFAGERMSQEEDFRIAEWRRK